MIHPRSKDPRSQSDDKSAQGNQGSGLESPPVARDEALCRGAESRERGAAIVERQNQRKDKSSEHGQRPRDNQALGRQTVLSGKFPTVTSHQRPILIACPATPTPTTPA